MYYKGGSMLHMMRQIVGNDETWRGMLRGLNKTFWHQTVTGAQVQAYINKQAGMDFSKVFEQYLTTTKIPVLEYKVDERPTLLSLDEHRAGIRDAGQGDGRERVSAGVAAPHRRRGRRFPRTVAKTDSLVVDPNFYVQAKRAPSQP